MPALAQYTVLVVDDEPAVVEELASYFRRRGLPVLTAANAIQAFDRLRDNRDIGAVIADIHMPGLSGIDLVTQLRRDYSPAAMPGIVLISAVNGAAEELAVRGVDDVAFLRKPFRMAQLEALVRQALESARARRNPTPG